MGAAMRERKNVVYLLRWGDPAFLLTLLAQRVRRDISVAYAFPCSTVSAARCWITVKLFISSRFLLGMFLTVPSIGKVRTAGIRARTSWTSGHRFTSFGHKKSPRKISLNGGSRHTFRWYNYTVPESKRYVSIPSSLPINKIATTFSGDGVWLDLYL